MLRKGSQNLIIIFLLLGLGAFLFFKTSNKHLSAQDKNPSESKSEVVQNRALTVTPAPTLAETSVPSIKKVIINSKQSGSPIDHYSHVPKDQVVEFKLVDGLAIAYGDVVIGKVPSDFNQSVGLTEFHTNHLWKSNEIPFLIDSGIQNKTEIELAMELIQSHTHIRFTPRTDQEDAIVFVPGKENCFSSVGRIGGLQPIYLEPRCSKLEITHELMHALGFVHEQSRTDRDNFVTILWENIQTPFQSQYAIVPEEFMMPYGDTPFDPSSILMYNPHTFSTAPDLETMKLKNGSAIQNAPLGLSEIDIDRVNRLYRN